MENLSGDDDIMFLEFNTELSATTGVPSGIYEISDNFEPGSMVPGWMEENGTPWGTWYFGKTKNDIVSGFVKVTNVNNSDYKFELNLTDYFGNVVIGTYQMPLQYFNFSEISLGPSPIKKIFSLNKISPKISFRKPLTLNKKYK